MEYISAVKFIIGYEKICGVIKQNQSEVGQIQFSFFQLTVCTIFTASFAEKSIEIGQLVPKI